MATLFAWTGALKKRGELDGTPELVRFAENLEKASLETIEDGIMTGDLASLSTLPNKKAVDTETFLREINNKLALLL
jgi:isocitrate dehydrogenase